MGCCLSKRKVTRLTISTANFLEDQTKFEHKEVCDMYEKFMGEFPDGTITVNDLRKIYKEYYPEGDPDSFANLIFNRFDINGDGFLDFKEFMVGLSLLNRGSVEEKLRFIFGLFDDDNSGFISMDEMVRVIEIIDKMIPLQNCTPGERAEYLFHMVDVNHDGDISLDEFVEAVKLNTSVVYPIPI